MQSLCQLQLLKSLYHCKLTYVIFVRSMQQELTVLSAVTFCRRAAASSEMHSCDLNVLNVCASFGPVACEQTFRRAVARHGLASRQHLGVPTSLAQSCSLVLSCQAAQHRWEIHLSPQAVTPRALTAAVHLY